MNWGKQGILLVFCFFCTPSNLFWVLSSPCALKTGGVHGLASSSWDLVYHLPCPAARHIPQVQQSWGRGLSQLDHSIFLMGVSLWGVCKRWRETPVCCVQEASVCQPKRLEVPLLALSWRAASDGNGAKEPLQMRGFPKLWGS